MLILGLDFETTGLDPVNDRVIEVGMALWDTGLHRAVKMADFLVDPGFKPAGWADAEKVHGISYDSVLRTGLPEEAALARMAGFMHAADFTVAHNGTLFDRPFLNEWRRRLPGRISADPPWIDTRVDLPEPMTGRLTCLAAEHGFLNPLPHNALGDVITMLLLLDKYDLGEVCRRAMLPTITVQAMVSFQSNQLAKDRGYYWAPAPVKQWRKAIKLCDLGREESEAKFAVRRIG